MEINFKIQKSTIKTLYYKNRSKHQTIQMAPTLNQNGNSILQSLSTQIETQNINQQAYPIVTQSAKENIKITFDINIHFMGRSKTLQINFVFIKNLNLAPNQIPKTVEQAFAIQPFELEEDEDDGELYFRHISIYLRSFINFHNLPSEVRLTFIDFADHQMKQLKPDFRIAHRTIQQSYGGSFVIQVQSKIEYYSQRLDQVIERLEMLFQQVEELRRTT